MYGLAGIHGPGRFRGAGYDSTHAERQDRPGGTARPGGPACQSYPIGIRRRETPSNSRWQVSGRRCSALNGWGLTTISSTSVGTRFFRSLCCRGCSRCSQEPNRPWPSCCRGNDRVTVCEDLIRRGGLPVEIVVKLRDGKSGRAPFFCVPGAGGNILSLRPLALAMPDDRPFYCLQAKGLDGSEPFVTVEDTAKCYAEQIRRVQPVGPYHLGGGCYGGIVAFETARVLEAEGEDLTHPGPDRHGQCRLRVHAPVAPDALGEPQLLSPAHPIPPSGSGSRVLRREARRGSSPGPALPGGTCARSEP